MGSGNTSSVLVPLFIGVHGLKMGSKRVHFMPRCCHFMPRIVGDRRILTENLKDLTKEPYQRTNIALLERRNETEPFFSL